MSKVNVNDIDDLFKGVSDKFLFFFFFQAEDGIRDDLVTGVQTCALPISSLARGYARGEAVDTAPTARAILFFFAGFHMSPFSAANRAVNALFLSRNSNLSDRKSVV